jgi:hypothetical protein
MEPQTRPKTDNPLRQFFRQPAIYIRLPSNGKGWRPGSLNMPQSGELPVYPMTAIDEITYKTPDALFNGEAVVSVIQSCMPNILDAWAVPSTDIDAILVAIRIASYGHSMDIGTTCPECKTENEFGLDLRTVIDRLEAADYAQPLSTGDLEIYFRPLDYHQINANSQYQFQQQKTLAALDNTEIPETDRVNQINAMMRQIMDVTVNTITQSILEIRAPSTIVSEAEHIHEFVAKCDRDMFNKIRDKVVALREASELKPLSLTCPSCQHRYQQAFTMDMSRFFASDS